MGFQGNLDSVSFADILQLLAMGKKTGTLFLDKDGALKEVCFKDGSIIWAHSTEDSDLLENQLLKQGRITKEDLAKGKEIMRLTSRDLPSTLVFLGLFSKEEVSEIVLSHIEAIIFSVFGWESGKFIFKDNELPDALHIIHALNTMNILMEGTRRIDEWTRIRGALPPDNTVLQVVPTAMKENEEIRLTPAEAQILSLVDGERSIEEIMDKSPFGELETSRSLYGLKMAGITRKVGVKESKKVARDEGKEVLQILVKAYVIIFEVVREVLKKKLGNAGVRVVKNNFEKTAKKYVVLKHISISENGELDFVNFITMVEKLPESSRIHEVSGGLSTFLTKMMDSVLSTMGGRQKKQILSQAIYRTEELLNGKIELLKKYGVYSDLNRIIGE